MNGWLVVGAMVAAPVGVLAVMFLLAYFGVRALIRSLFL